MCPMKRVLIVEFTKMNGAGNDFIVLDNRFYEFSVSELSQVARQLCPRRTGIGADGLLVLATAEHPDADYRMIYVNADGSEGTMCGNGARCLAKFAFEGGVHKTTVHMQTASGVCEVNVPKNAPVRIYLEPPRNYDGSIKLSKEIPGVITSVHYLWPGTEHLVCFTSSVGQLPVGRWGERLRRDPALRPNGANINFVMLDPESPDTGIHVRTFEKGVEAETLACGTGAIASVVAARKAGLITSDVCNVQMPGGTLTVGLEKDRVYLEGPAEFVFRGSIELDNPG